MSRATHAEAVRAKCPACEGWGFNRSHTPLTACTACGGSGNPASPAPTPAGGLLAVDQESRNV